MTQSETEEGVKRDQTSPMMNVLSACNALESLGSSFDQNTYLKARAMSLLSGLSD